MRLAVEPLDAPVGAILSGVDGRETLSDHDFHLIEQALLEHLVVVIPELFAHSQRDEFCYRHRWATGQLVAIDNRATLHCAMADYRDPMRKLRMIAGCTERDTPGAGNLLN